MVMLRKEGVGRLLRTVRGRAAEEQDTEDAGSSVTSKAAQEQEDFEREPESSEDEELAAAAAQVDMSRGKNATSNAVTGAMSRATNRVVQEIAKRNEPTRVSSRSIRPRFTDETPTQAGQKRKSEDISKLDDDEAWSNMMSSQPSQTTKHKYGGSQGRFSQNGNGFKQPPRNIHASASPGSSPTKSDGFKRPEMTTSPRKGSQGQVPMQLPTPPSSSPSAASNGPKFRKYDLGALDAKPGAREADRDFRGPRGMPNARVTRSGNRSSAPIDIESDGDDDEALSDVSSRLSTPPPEADLSDEELAFVATQTQSEKDLARCPVCQDVVDKEALELFTNGNRLGWRDKQSFCESHQRRSAERTWKERGYPEIDWDPAEFRKRIDQHSGELDLLLRGDRRSEYRERLQRKVGTGRIRKVFRDVNEAKKDIVMPGYYGPRGSQIFQAHLLSTLNTRLKDMAESDDTLVRAAGAGNFVSSVLVPEVAMMLIQEDMECDEGRAMEIMEQSADVGKLINSVGEEDEVRIKKER